MNATEAKIDTIKPRHATQRFHVLGAKSPNSLLYTQSREA